MRAGKPESRACTPSLPCTTFPRFAAAVSISLFCSLTTLFFGLPSDQAYRHYASGMSSVLAMAKRLAVECQREVRRRLVRPSVRLEKEAGKRAKKLVGDMTLYWRRNEKLERERRKKAEKELEEQRRREAEEREARRQQRKFNYLITQTELYAHFMRNKTTGGMDSSQVCKFRSLFFGFFLLLGYNSFLLSPLAIANVKATPVRPRQPPAAF